MVRRPGARPWANDRSLSQTQIDTIAKWVDAGAPQGDAKDAPAPIDWAPDGWQIKPDLIVRGPEFRVPARPEKNVIEWTTINIPSGFTKDTWITSVEVKPSELAVTHHICISFSPHRPNRPYYVMNYAESPRDEDGVATDRSAGVAGAPPPPPPGRDNPGTAANGGFWCYVPGGVADDYRPYGAGKLVPANMDITVQMHYTPTGKEVVDRPLFGFTVSEEPPARQWLATQVSGAGATFAIPPNDANWAAPPAQVEFLADVELVQMMPHMHLRGKDMTYHVIFPDGRDRDRAERAEVRLQLAGRLSGGAADQDPEGVAAAGRGALQQLVVEQVQSRSEPDGLSRSHDVGGDVQPVLRRDRRQGHRPDQGHEAALRHRRG